MLECAEWMRDAGAVSNEINKLAESWALATSLAKAQLNHTLGIDQRLAGVLEILRAFGLR